MIELDWPTFQLIVEDMQTQASTLLQMVEILSFNVTAQILYLMPFCTSFHIISMALPQLFQTVSLFKTSCN